VQPTPLPWQKPFAEAPAPAVPKPVVLKPTVVQAAPTASAESIVAKMQRRAGGAVPVGFTELAQRTMHTSADVDVNAYNLAMQLYSGTLEEQIEACAEFGRQRRLEAVPVLTGIIARGNADLIPEACWALGEIGDRRAVGVLVQVLGRSERLMLLRAIEALGKIGDRSAAPYIISCLAACEDELKPAILKALANIGGNTAAKGLELLAEDMDYHLAQRARDALAACDRSND